MWDQIILHMGSCRRGHSIYYEISRVDEAVWATYSDDWRIWRKSEVRWYVFVLLLDHSTLLTCFQRGHSKVWITAENPYYERVSDLLSCQGRLSVKRQCPSLYHNYFHIHLSTSTNSVQKLGATDCWMDDSMPSVTQLYDPRSLQLARKEEAPEWRLILVNKREIINGIRTKNVFFFRGVVRFRWWSD